MDDNKKDISLPVMMSTSSFVIAAWRPRLYCIVRRLIMSDAFLDALSMALRLEGVSMLRSVYTMGA